jgi:hypothetical protein
MLEELLSIPLFTFPDEVYCANSVFLVGAGGAYVYAKHVKNSWNAFETQADVLYRIYSTEDSQQGEAMLADNELIEAYNHLPGWLRGAASDRIRRHPLGNYASSAVFSLLNRSARKLSFSDYLENEAAIFGIEGFAAVLTYNAMPPIYQKLVDPKLISDSMGKCEEQGSNLRRH